MYEAWAIEPHDNGLLYVQYSGQIANGIFNSYHHALGFVKTNKILIQAEIKNGVIVKISKFNKQGNLVYTNETSSKDIRTGEIKYWVGVLNEQESATEEIIKNLIESDTPQAFNITMHMEYHIYSEVKHLLKYLKNIERNLSTAFLETRLYYDCLWQIHYFSVVGNRTQVKTLYNEVKKSFDEKWRSVFDKDSEFAHLLGDMVYKHDNETISAANKMYIGEKLPSEYEGFIEQTYEKLKSPIDEFECTDKQVRLTAIYTYKLFKSGILVDDTNLFDIASQILPTTIFPLEGETFLGTTSVSIF